eukprot:scaffold109128_cov19-Prasinocladus_malaysianus.AAC.1
MSVRRVKRTQQHGQKALSPRQTIKFYSTYNPGAFGTTRVRVLNVPRQAAGRRCTTASTSIDAIEQWYRTVRVLVRVLEVGRTGQSPLQTPGGSPAEQDDRGGTY